MKPCTICEKLISPMDTFSEGECLQCHESRFNEYDDNTAPDFTATINA